LTAAKRVEVILRATAVNLEAGADRNSISRLAVRGWNGRHFSVSARIFILACGGIENARLLLLSQRQEAAPSINWDVVGRYYMNHPRAENVGRLHLAPGLPRREETARRLVMHRAPQVKGRLQFSFSPDESLQRQEGLLNVSSFFYAVSDEKARSIQRALLEVQSPSAKQNGNYLASLARLVRNFPLLANGAIHRMQLKPFRPDYLVVVDQCEQSPDPESRVSLGEAQDRFGNPLPRLDWRLDPQTTASLRRLHGLMADMCSSLGLGRFESKLLDEPGWVPPYADCAHPMGATRMSESERTGVVDSHCRVHGMRNLFIAGSSVFPVGGHANPTFTIVALAVRLASLLRSELA
jgi:choline dehydrogenase-like flavoprotein